VGYAVDKEPMGWGFLRVISSAFTNDPYSYLAINSWYYCALLIKNIST
jgi:hypothetical protein